MSTLSEQSRDAAREKAARLTRTPKGDVDASGWREPLGEQGRAPGVQTGPRPVSRRQFKAGGKVSMHAGRKPRAKGGTTKTDGGLINTDVKEMNEAREGPKHVGGMKRGGRAHKMIGGPNFGGRPMPAPARMPGRPVAGMEPRMAGRFASGGHVKGCSCAKCSGGEVRRARAAGGPTSYGGSRPMGGRIARAKGGRSKKGMNVNIIIAAPGGGSKPPMPMPMPPPGGPIGMRQGVPPPMPPPGLAGGAPPPPMAPAPMMRKRGGRTGYPIETGAGGARGRLDKIAAYGGP